MMKSGFTLVGAVIGLVVVVIAVMAISRLTHTLNVGEKRLDQRLVVEELMAGQARTLIEMDYQEVLDLCRKPSGGGTAPMSQAVKGNCLASDGSLNMGSATAPAGTTQTIEVRLDSAGNPDTKGKFCLELTRCELTAARHLLDLTLTGYYPDADANRPATSRSLKFRRTRW